MSNSPVKLPLTILRPEFEVAVIVQALTTLITDFLNDKKSI